MREVYDPALKALLDALLGDARAARGDAPRAVLAAGRSAAPARAARARPRAGRARRRATTRISAACSSTRSPWRRWRSSCARCTRAWTATCCCAAAIVHDLGKTREFTYGAEIERSREGALLGHVELGLRVIAAHVPASLDGERRLALEHCVMLHHGADSASGQRFASPRRWRCTG